MQSEKQAYCIHTFLDYSTIPLPVCHSIVTFLFFFLPCGALKDRAKTKSSNFELCKPPLRCFVDGRCSLFGCGCNSSCRRWDAAGVNVDLRYLTVLFFLFFFFLSYMLTSFFSFYFIFILFFFNLRLFFSLCILSILQLFPRQLFNCSNWRCYWLFLADSRWNHFSSVKL